jgi:hypothetical protein
MNDGSLPASPEEFFLKFPLYEKSYFSGAEVYDVVDTVYFRGVIDAYCPSCKRTATFRGQQHEIPAKLSRDLGEVIESQVDNYAPTIKNGVYPIVFQCARNSDHTLHFIVFIDNYSVSPGGEPTAFQSIQKIGQYPSYADLNIPQIKHLAPVLSKQDRREFYRAVGLAAHGVGVGSYVYLRRIFENLIEDARKEASAQGHWDDTLQGEYDKSRVKERIQLLKDYLPDFVVEHPEMYALLSKGMHELTEDECLKHFDTLKVAIEIILEQKFAAREKEKRLAAAKKAISIAHDEVKGGNS